MPIESFFLHVQKYIFRKAEIHEGFSEIVITKRKKLRIFGKKMWNNYDIRDMSEKKSAS